ncbi:MAG: transposase [Chitinophagales bacterium]
MFDNKETAFVLEPTGTYSDKLVKTLEKLNFSMKLINPQKSSAFMKVLGITTKDDKQAARALDIMGSSLEIPDYQPSDENIRKRKQLQMTLNALEKQERQLKNQMHSVEQYQDPQDIVLEVFKDMLKSTQGNIEKIKQALNDMIDIQFEDFKKLACSVVGIGEKTAHLLYTYTNGFETFDNAKQLVKFIGTVPLTHQSGSSVFHKGRITKADPAQIRSVLYNATKSAVQYNEDCKELFHRLRAKGKPHKVARVAVINKFRLFKSLKKILVFLSR